MGETSKVTDYPRNPLNLLLKENKNKKYLERW
jgi:hypothetical protein